jgi:hypothetical protein
MHKANESRTHTPPRATDGGQDPDTFQYRCRYVLNMLAIVASFSSSGFLATAPMPVEQPPAIVHVSRSAAKPMLRPAVAAATAMEPRMSAASADVASPSARVAALVESGAGRTDPELAAEVKSLLSTASPPSSALDWSDVAGTWKVVHAPHIDTLSKLAMASFDIQYKITPEGSIASYVRYYSPIVGAGWLCTDGFIANEPTTEAASSSVRIVWDQIWWVPSDDYRSGPPTDPQAEDAALPKIVQAVGKAGFIESLSVFPVRYVDARVAIFNFQAFTVTCMRD